MGSMNEIHQYGRQLLGMKLFQQAFDIFKMNYDKNPDQYTTLMGMTRAYSGLGDFKNAARYGTMALAKAPDEVNKKYTQGLIDKLKEGKDIK